MKTGKNNNVSIILNVTEAEKQIFYKISICKTLMNDGTGTLSMTNYA